MPRVHRTRPRMKLPLLRSLRIQRQQIQHRKRQRVLIHNLLPPVTRNRQPMRIPRALTRLEEPRQGTARHQEMEARRHPRLGP